MGRVIQVFGSTLLVIASVALLCTTWYEKGYRDGSEVQTSIVLPK